MTVTLSKTSPVQHESRIDLSKNIRAELIPSLNTILAHLLDLQSQVKFAHWNVRGIQFYSLHELFDRFADTLSEHIDTVAERIVTLGGIAYGTIRQAAEHSSLPEFPTKSAESLVVVAALADRYAQVGHAVRELIDVSSEKDADTADILTAASRDLDKNLWILEAHLSV